jgi:diguanylate cyclase (GGDEF)-like protein
MTDLAWETVVKLSWKLLGNGGESRSQSFSWSLEEEISRLHRSGHPLSVVLIDLDDFKAVNDELGHTAGDDTLREVAQLMMQHLRSDNIMARYGGDEFAILLVETPKAGAPCYAERLR